MTVQYRTPGVYVEELDAFPPSIVGVETAVPAFIGYTEKAERNGRSVLMQPVAITSMVDYAAVFGGAYKYQFAFEPTTGDEVADVNIGGTGYKLVPNKQYNLYNSMRLFYANGGGNCYVVAVDTYGGADLTQSPPQEGPDLDFDDLKSGLDAVGDLVGPTMLVIPEAVNLSQDDYNKLIPAMLQQCYEKQDRVAIIDVWGMAHPFPLLDQKGSQQFATFDDAVNGDKGFRSKSAVVTASEMLRYGMAYAPFLKTSIVDPTEVSFENFKTYDPATFQHLNDSLRKAVDQLYPPQVPPPAPTSPPTLSKADQLKNYYDGQMTAIQHGSPPLSDDEQEKRKKALNQTLVAQVPVFGDIYAAMAAKLGLLPPSPAMAGIYTINDTARGVWNAPANVGLVAVTAPAIRINNNMQDDLNMPIGGLAINAIRDFPGRGTLVWGARTLDGNSNDWRYIQVRRCLIYIEQSVELALNKFVFEPNVAQTWVTVTSMIGAFLRDLWAAGGLMGATPQEAFSVQCGLGSTMTADDVLNGKMIVQIKLQMVHPAEFIVLVFQQQMQGAGS